MDRGDEVTNGAWVGKVLAVHGAYVWVQPTRKVDDDSPGLFRDEGPLTFRRETLSSREAS